MIHIELHGFEQRDDDNLIFHILSLFKCRPTFMQYLDEVGIEFDYQTISVHQSRVYSIGRILQTNDHQVPSRFNRNWAARPLVRIYFSKGLDAEIISLPIVHADKNYAIELIELEQPLDCFQAPKRGRQ